jgi:hypothetical protein
MNMPKWSILEIVKVSGTNNLLSGERPILAQCDKCGADLYAKAYYIIDNETEINYVLGSTCVKIMTSFTASKIMQENADYDFYCESLARLRVKKQEYYQLNRSWINYLEKLSEKNDFWKSIKDNYEKFGSLTSNMLNLLKCNYIKSRSTKSFSGRIKLDNALVMTVKEDFDEEYGAYRIAKILYNRHIFITKTYESTKIFKYLKIGNKFSGKATVKKVSHGETWINRITTND